jgi:hypothetical protein
VQTYLVDNFNFAFFHPYLPPHFNSAPHLTHVATLPPVLGSGVT